jgi:hypothetical protein
VAAGLGDDRDAFFDQFTTERAALVSVLFFGERGRWAGHRRHDRGDREPDIL